MFLDFPAYVANHFVFVVLFFVQGVLLFKAAFTDPGYINAPSINAEVLTAAYDHAQHQCSSVALWQWDYGRLCLSAVVSLRSGGSNVLKNSFRT